MSDFRINPGDKEFYEKGYRTPEDTTRARMYVVRELTRDIFVTVLKAVALIILGVIILSIFTAAGY